MYKNDYSTERLADAFLDLREIENTMGRYVNSLLLKKEDTIMHEFWSRFEDDLCLGVNDGWFTGRKAVSEYYEALYKNTCARSALIQKMFPNFLGGLTDEEVHGVGAMIVDAIAPPCIEVSGYGTTAKGVWLFINTCHEIMENGPYTIQENGYYAVDFIKEGTNWKIWHMQRIIESRAPQEVNWADKWELPPSKPGFIELSELKIPVPNRPGVIREIYRPDRPQPIKLRLPEPFYDWKDTFSYGPDMPEYTRAMPF